MKISYLLAVLYKKIMLLLMNKGSVIYGLFLPTPCATPIPAKALECYREYDGQRANDL